MKRKFKIRDIYNYNWLEKIMENRNKHISWFTLIEMIISVTIISIIMLSIFEIYSNIILTNKRLELQRVLQENTKNITEWLASEVRNYWIDYSYYDPSIQELDYWSWNTILAINNWKRYCLKRNPSFCDNTCYTDPKNCMIWSFWSSELSLSDDLVEINNLKFFISWKSWENTNSQDKEWKVTMIFDISIAKGKWVQKEIIEDTKMHIQTTISEMYYKK